MKNIILILSLIALSINSALAYNYNKNITDESIKENQYLEYSTEQKNWLRTDSSNPAAFVKHITHGTGGFSEFEQNKNIYGTGTTYEFLYKNQLIGYNGHKLKFYKLEFDNNKIQNIPLSDNEIQELFPDVEIVKLSQFKNNKITLYKPWFKKKTFLLINDTDKDFYKYQFEGYKNQTELIKGLVEISRPQTLIFSHFGSRDKLFPILKITVKNKI